MNVNDIAYMYNSAMTDSSVGAVLSSTKTGRITEELRALKTEMEKKGVGNDSKFSDALGEEISKITESGKTSELSSQELAKVSEFRALAGALDHSVLGNMVEGASDKELAQLSEELLGSSKGRDTLSKLVEGHFTNMVLDASDDDNDHGFSDAADSLNDTVNRSQELIDRLDAVADTLKTAEGDEEDA